MQKDLCLASKEEKQATTQPPKQNNKGSSRELLFTS